MIGGLSKEGYSRKGPSGVEVAITALRPRLDVVKTAKIEWY